MIGPNVKKSVGGKSFFYLIKCKVKKCILYLSLQHS